MIKNNPSHKSGAKSTLCNVAMKWSLLLLHIFIRTCSFCFAVTWCLPATPICLSILSKEPGIKSETSGVVWNVAPEFKIQLVNYELSPKFPPGHSSLPDIIAIYTYIFWLLLFLPFLHAQLPFSLKHTFFCRFSFSFGGFGHFSIRVVPSRNVHFFYMCSHLSALQNCAFIFSTNFQFVFTFK